MSSKVRVCLIGVGGMARAHLRAMLQQNSAEIVATCDPSSLAAELTNEVFKQHGLPPPPHYSELEALLSDRSGALGAAVISTPHALHHHQAKACLEAGLDVLLEKPMVMNVAEARSLIETRNRTGRLLVVAFQGSLSPQIRLAVNLLRSGELGNILNISGVVWQNWGSGTANTWRQNPALSGGGFMFDTGAHMLNTVADLAGEDFVEVAAWLDCRERPVDILGAVMGRLRSGALVTINACGEAIPSCTSDIHVFCTKGILRTGQWGERLEVQRYGRKQLRPVKLPPSSGAWEQFVAVRGGIIPNPSPPEIGLRMVQLWNAIQESAGRGGAMVRPEF
jgi:predicted dehydrogenase